MKNYIDAELDIVKFDAEDIITTSPVEPELAPQYPTQHRQSDGCLIFAYLRFDVFELKIKKRQIFLRVCCYLKSNML